MAKANSHDQGINPQATAPSGADLDDETISKVGKALRQMSEIKEVYSQRLASAATEDERLEVAERAQDAALEALGGQGLSVERYEQVLTAAEDDLSLEQRLLAAVRTT
jgi:hypothetical protein